MEFITTGNRIAVENFVIGYFYTITMLSGNYFQACCTGIGSDFVMFLRDEPDLLFSLTLQSAADVSSIELYGGGSGTNDYNDLSNKPQINGVTLIGNKSLSDLGIQDIISDLDTIRIGAAAGSTAVQPAAMSAALATKQDTLSSAQLAAVNSGIDSTKVAQIEINKNNILFLAASVEKTAYACTAADTYEYTGISINIPAQQVFELNIADFSNKCTAIAISDSNSNLASGNNIVAENATEYSVGNAYTWSRQVSCITAPSRPANKLYYIWIKRSNTTSSDIQVIKRRLV